MTAEAYRMVEPQTFYMSELEAVSALDAVYADSYEPKFPSALEIAVVCAVMIFVVAPVRLCRWTFEKTTDLGPVIPVVLVLLLGSLAIFVHNF